VLAENMIVIPEQDFSGKLASSEIVKSIFGGEVQEA
jgi:hypothetical protein